jgi:transcriptional regulator with XRE-family HTH domain
MFDSCQNSWIFSLPRVKRSWVAKSLGRAIQELRVELGLSRAALARAASLDPAAVSHIEKGERTQLRFTTACQIANALGISTDELANRAGLTKTKRIGRSKPSQGPAMAADVETIESLLRRAASQLGQLKKRLSSEP